MKKNAISLLLVLLLTACGFHLRGIADIPEWLNNVAIINDADDKQLAVLLEAQLEGYKIEVNKDPDQAKYWLILLDSAIKQQIISIGASTNPRQYQLILTVRFELKARNGQVIKPTKQILITRQLTVNNDRILGSNEEESILINEMRQDAVIQIINRLSRK